MQTRAVPLRKIAFDPSLYPCYARRTVYTGAPRLADETVFLDAFRLQDAEAHLAGEDEELARRFGWYPGQSTLAGVLETIERWQAQWSTQGPTRCFALRMASNGELVGGCELRLQPDGTASMSYWTFPQYRRRGLGTRAVQLAAEYAFACLQVAEIELYSEPDNIGSLGVAAGYSSRLLCLLLSCYCNGSLVSRGCRTRDSACPGARARVFAVPALRPR
jgi:RimJ/RimL family protein N-acetyltransferase